MLNIKHSWNRMCKKGGNIVDLGTWQGQGEGNPQASLV